MAGVTMRSTGTLEALLKVYSTPDHNAGGVVHTDEEIVNGSDVDPSFHSAASDSIVTSDAFHASKAGTTRSAVISSQEGVDNLALNEASPPLRSKANKISGPAASNPGTQRSAWGSPEDGDDGFALEEASPPLRSNGNKISRFAASKPGTTSSAQGSPHEGDDSLALDQGSSVRGSNINKIPKHAVSTSDVNDVVSSRSDVNNVDVDQHMIGSNPHAQYPRFYQFQTTYTEAYYMGCDTPTQCGNGFLFTPAPPLQTFELHTTQRTTILLRNMPKNYNTSRVVCLLESVGCKGMFDFVDVPSNRTSRTTGGFAIVNLIHPAYAPFFWKTFEGFTEWTCKSKNICRVVWYDQLQGLYQIINRYKNLIIVRKDIPKQARPWLLNEEVLGPFARRA